MAARGSAGASVDADNAHADGDRAAASALPCGVAPIGHSSSRWTTSQLKGSRCTHGCADQE